MNGQSVVIKKQVLSLADLRSWLLCGGLVVAAGLLPAAIHLLGLPVRILLPIHWPVILAGLVFGWQGGLLVGALSPLVSHLFSGMPLLSILPAMTVELAVYGVVAGVLRQRTTLGGWLMVAVALAAGRVAFIIMVLITAPYPTLPAGYFREILLLGLPAAIVQVLLLPRLASYWVSRSDMAERSKPLKHEH